MTSSWKQRVGISAAAQLLEHPLGEVVAAELGRRGVDRDVSGTRRPRSSQPRMSAITRSIIRSLICGGDLEVLERGLERGGRADPAARRAPAQQRLEADDRGARARSSLGW